jgi:hypothetical protein
MSICIKKFQVFLMAGNYFPRPPGVNATDPVLNDPKTLPTIRALVLMKAKTAILMFWFGTALDFTNVRMKIDENTINSKYDEYNIGRSSIVVNADIN